MFPSSARPSREMRPTECQNRYTGLDVTHNQHRGKVDKGRIDLQISANISPDRRHTHLQNVRRRFQPGLDRMTRRTVARFYQHRPKSKHPFHSLDQRLGEMLDKLLSLQDIGNMPRDLDLSLVSPPPQRFALSPLLVNLHQRFI